ncbi:MAG TPA: hypothetical protein VLG37_00375 [Candidatus Saccharimonadales bacterium]|nr:hypothetical protein [Candidatus Saccharimonadales bacterium]
MSIKKSQDGFGAIEVVLVIVVVGLIAFAGWYMWHSKKNPATNAGTSQATGSSSSSSASSFLEIPEFGIKLKTSADISDLYYSYKQVSPYPQALLASRSLEKLDPNCAADKSSQSLVTYYTDPKAQTETEGGTSTNAEAYPNATKIDNKYFYLVPSNGPCTVKEGTESKLSSVMDALKIVTIEKL